MLQAIVDGKSGRAHLWADAYFELIDRMNDFAAAYAGMNYGKVWAVNPPAGIH